MRDLCNIQIEPCKNGTSKTGQFCSMQNLIEMFPDATESNRANLKINQQRYNIKTHSGHLLSTPNEKLEKFYDNEFKKWHYKFLCILLGCFVTIYFMIANAPGFIKLVMS